MKTFEILPLLTAMTSADSLFPFTAFTLELFSMSIWTIVLSPMSELIKHLISDLIFKKYYLVFFLTFFGSQSQGCITILAHNVNIGITLNEYLCNFVVP